MEHIKNILNITSDIFICIIVFSIILCLFYQHKLLKYLREKHYEKWKYLTTIRGMGPGWVNGFRGVPFLFNCEDLSDMRVIHLKQITRNFIILTITGAIAWLIIDILNNSIGK